MRPDSLANDRRNYWPRPGPAAWVPDLGDDRPCAQCGYSLRGLPFDSACPECGASPDLIPGAPPIPWNEAPSFGSYFETVLMALTRPGELAQQVWTRDMLWQRPARRFRAIHVLLGTLGLCPVIVAMQAESIGLAPALLCAPFDAIAVMWWFITLTGDPVRFLADKGTPTASRRAGVLSSYASAALVLSPLHLLLLAFPVTINGIEPIGMALALHVALVLVQVITVAAGESALLWQLVDLPRGGAFLLSAGVGLVRCLRGAIYVAGLPTVFALMANGMAGR